MPPSGSSSTRIAGASTTWLSGTIAALCTAAPTSTTCAGNATCSALRCLTSPIPVSTKASPSQPRNCPPSFTAARFRCAPEHHVNGFGNQDEVRALTKGVIAAGMIGNALEWYDFAIYGYFAAQIGRYFFPHEDAVAQLLSAFAVFAIGYLMRPIGVVIVGHIGDRFGLRAALTFSVAAMAIPTFLIGLLPGYQTIGLLAPIGLTLLRVVQGLSVGGEYTSSMVFLVERAPERRRGLMGALAGSGSAVGILLGSAVGAGFAASMSSAALDAWGWRISFLLGLVVGIAGYILRRHVLETALAEKRTRAPIVETLHDHWRVVAGFAGLTVFNAVTFYVGFVYLVSWLQTADGIPPSRSLEINTFSMVASLPVLIAAGWLRPPGQSQRARAASFNHLVDAHGGRGHVCTTAAWTK